jgi:hypothetical protein
VCAACHQVHSACLLWQGNACKMHVHIQSLTSTKINCTRLQQGEWCPQHMLQICPICPPVSVTAHPGKCLRATCQQACQQLQRRHCQLHVKQVATGSASTNTRWCCCTPWRLLRAASIIFWPAWTITKCIQNHLQWLCHIKGQPHGSSIAATAAAASDLASEWWQRVWWVHQNSSGSLW